METREFVQLFSPEVRVMIDWTLLERNCDISLEIVVTRAELGELQTVWHVRRDGTLGEWRNQDANRLCVAEAAQMTGFPSKEGAAFIDIAEREFRQGLHPRVWGIPMYRTSIGRCIVLDGNHRLAALYRSNAPIRIIAAVAQGYDDERLFPDLLRDYASNLSPSEWSFRVEAVEKRLAKVRLR